MKSSDFLHNALRKKGYNKRAEMAGAVLPTGRRTYGIHTYNMDDYVYGLDPEKKKENAAR